MFSKLVTAAGEKRLSSTHGTLQAARAWAKKTHTQKRGSREKYSMAENFSKYCTPALTAARQGARCGRLVGKNSTATCGNNKTQRTPSNYRLDVRCVFTLHKEGMASQMF